MVLRRKRPLHGGDERDEGINLCLPRRVAAAHVEDLRSAADKTGALVREILKPLPILPRDPVQREQTLAMALLAKDTAARRLLALVERAI